MRREDSPEEEEEEEETGRPDEVPVVQGGVWLLGLGKEGTEECWHELGVACLPAETTRRDNNYYTCPRRSLSLSLYEGELTGEGSAGRILRGAV
jgi:hypothetical protein